MKRNIEDRLNFLGVKVTVAMGTMYAAIFLTIISLFAIPGSPFPQWASDWSNWLCQVWLPLVLVPVMLVGQIIQGKKIEQRDQETHDTVLTVLEELTSLVTELHAKHDELARTVAAADSTLD